MQEVEESRLNDEIRLVNETVNTVHDLTVAISTLVEEQSEHISKIEKNTALTVEKLFEGVKILAKNNSYKLKSYTTRASLTGAVVGGTLGLTSAHASALLIGVICGVLIGGYLGSSLVALTKSLITSDIDRLEKILAFRCTDESTVYTRLKVFEVERRLPVFGYKWIRYKSSIGRSKQRSFWTDEGMLPVTYKYPSPERFQKTFTRLNPEIYLSKALGEGVYEECKEMIDLFNWKWSPNGWRKYGGWEYGYTLSSTDWSHQPSISSLVRRQAWVIDIVGNASSVVEAVKDQGDDSNLMMTSQSAVENDLYQDSQRVMSNTFNLNSDIAQHSEKQSQSIRNSLSRARIIKEVLYCAVRIKRMSRFFQLLVVLYKIKTRFIPWFNNSSRSQILNPSKSTVIMASSSESFEVTVAQNLQVSIKLNEQLTMDNSDLMTLQELLDSVEVQFDKVSTK